MFVTTCYTCDFQNHWLWSLPLPRLLDSVKGNNTTIRLCPSLSPLLAIESWFLWNSCAQCAQPHPRFLGCSWLHYAEWSVITRDAGLLRETIMAVMPYLPQACDVYAGAPALCWSRSLMMKGSESLWTESRLNSHALDWLPLQCVSQEEE